MYLQTFSISSFYTENAEADCCHENLPLHNLFSLINFVELFAMIVAILSSEIEGERDIRKCRC
jgi:hypothetical protein